MICMLISWMNIIVDDGLVYVLLVDLKLSRD